MIKVENLRKVYVSSSNNKCEALKGISFTLPQTGMVFICGKSGSGKSTLLNILGGLDKFTSGDIEINGVKFSNFTNSDYDNYRNKDVGFIFQDFCLINSLNIEENIKFSLDLQQKIDDGKIAKTLESLDLIGIEKRYPKELSGGQQQRVSIARALIKDPSLVLADEPTGNLDSKTSVQILNVLKEVSKENLVVIVSHNLDDALKYGDRIIELADGKIIQDIERNSKATHELIEGNVINLPLNGNLNENQIQEINNKIKDDNVIIKQAESDFVETVQPVCNVESKKPEKSKGLKMLSTLKLSKRMSKGFGFGMITTILMASLLIIILGFSQIFTWFNGESLLKDSVEKINSKMFVLQKGRTADNKYKTILTDRLVEATDSDIEKLYKNGYTGNVYKLYNTAMILNNTWQNSIESFRQQNIISTINEGYAKYGYGVLECDEDLLIDLYGQNGKLKILSGNLDADNPRQLIVTDYFADCMLHFNQKLVSTTEDKYAELTTRTTLDNHNFSIKAIIDTNYETEYASIFKEFEDFYKSTTLAERKAKLEELKESELFIHFCDEVQSYLAIGYYFGNDYISNCMNNETLIGMRARTSNSEFFDENGKILLSAQQTSFYQNSYYLPDDVTLAPDEVYVCASVYNSLFGTKVSYKNQEEFKERTITIKNYKAARDEFDEPIYTLTLKIKGLVTANSLGFVAHKDVYKIIKETSCVPYALYFDNQDSIVNMSDEFTEMNYYSNHQYLKTIYQILKVVEVFSDVFLIILIALSIACVIILMSVGLRSVKRRMYDIGVMRALGCKNKQIGLMFTMQILFVGVITCAISIIGIICLDGVVNNLLLTSMSKFMGLNENFLTLTLIQFNPLIILIILGLVLLITILATVIPFIAIRRIKPIKIIRKTD